jgi:hypothetical protein
MVFWPLVSYGFRVDYLHDSRKIYLGDMGKTAKHKLMLNIGNNRLNRKKIPFTKEESDRIRVIIVLLFLVIFSGHHSNRLAAP